MTETVTNVETGTPKSRFDQMRDDAQLHEDFPFPPAGPLADLEREVREAKTRYEIARIDAYERFCRTLVPALIEAYRGVYGEHVIIGPGLSEEDRALREITTKFPFDKFRV